MQDAGGGGGAGNAGPQERKLIQAFSANLETLDVSVSSWSSGATMLQNVARRLGEQADQLETTFGKDNPTGMAAAQRYREVQAKVTKRESEMRTASQALAHTRAGLVAAQDDYGKLPPVTTDPNAPQTDLERLMDPGGTLKKAAYDSERQQREAAATTALTKLDTHFEKSAEDLRTVAGDRPTERTSDGGSGDTTGGSSPLGHRTSAATISGVPTSTGGGEPRDPGPTDGGGDPGPPDRDPTDGGPDHPGPTTTGGNPGGGLAGGGGSYEPVTGTSGGYTGGSTATPTSGSGTAAASAVGAGAVSGAGAIAASRGGVSGVRPVSAPGTSAGAIGRSSSTASRGAIGRSGSMMPGQGNATRTGAAGRASSAGGRGAMAPGQGQGQKSAGKSGGRGTSGGRGGGGAMAPGQGGRTKDEKDLTQEHLAFADQESWLDDEGAADSVID